MIRSRLTTIEVERKTVYKKKLSNWLDYVTVKVTFGVTRSRQDKNQIRNGVVNLEECSISTKLGICAGITVYDL